MKKLIIINFLCTIGTLTAMHDISSSCFGFVVNTMVKPSCQKLHKKMFPKKNSPSHRNQTVIPVDYLKQCVQQNKSSNSALHDMQEQHISLSDTDKASFLLSYQLLEAIKEREINN